MHPRAGDCTGCIIGGPGERRPGRRRSCVYALGPVHHGHVTRPTWQPAALVAPDASPHPETDVPTAARSPVSSAARRRAAAPWRWPTHIAAAGRRTLLACTCYGLGDPYPKSPTRGAASRRPLRLRYSAWLEDCSLPVWMPGSRCATCKRPPHMLTREPRCGMTTLGNCISWARNRRSASHGRIGIAFCAPDGGSVTKQVSRVLPSDAGSVRWRVEVVRGALFKRTEEEKGLGGWAPVPRRGIRTVGITDSTITGPRQSGPARHVYSRRLRRRSHPVTGIGWNSSVRRPSAAGQSSHYQRSDRYSSVTHRDPRANANPPT